jgi:hypothetical protein
MGCRLSGKPLLARIPRCNVAPLSGAGRLFGVGRLRIEVVEQSGLGCWEASWTSTEKVSFGMPSRWWCRVETERIVWPFLAQDFRNVSHRPWWTCPVVFGSWGISGRCLRAVPVHLSPSQEEFRCGAALGRPSDAGPRGRAPSGVCSLGGCCRSRSVGCFGSRSRYRIACFSGRSFFGAVGSAPRVHLLDVSISLTGPLLGSAWEPGPSIPLFGAVSGPLSRHRPRVRSSEWARGRSSVRSSGRPQGQPSVRPSGRARGVHCPPFGVDSRPAGQPLFGVGGRCDAAVMVVDQAAGR